MDIFIFRFDLPMYWTTDSVVASISAEADFRKVPPGHAMAMLSCSHCLTLSR